MTAERDYHQTMLASQWRADNKAQAHDAAIERVIEEATNTLFAGREVRYGHASYQTLSPGEVMDSLGEPGSARVLRAVAALGMAARRGTPEQTKAAALALVQIFETSVTEQVQRIDDELLEWGQS